MKRFNQLCSAALVALVIVAGCTLTQPGSINTPEGQDELADLCDLTQLTCTEAARAASDEDQVKIDHGLGLLGRAMVEQVPLSDAQAYMKQAGLKSAWATRLATVYSITARRLKRYQNGDPAIQEIAGAVIESCRLGIAGARMTSAIEQTPAVIIGAWTPPGVAG